MDCETNGLLPTLTAVHCLVLRDLDSGHIIASYADQPGYIPIVQGLSLLSEAEVVYGHNAIDFDIPALQKVYPGFSLKGKLMDTLVLARLRFAHQKGLDYDLNRRGRLPGNLIGSHSLEAWGHRLGDYKGDYEGGWETWNPEMHGYCEQDTSVTRHLALHLRRVGVSDASSDTEHSLAWYLSAQKRNGWPFDLAKAVDLQATLAARREEIGRKLIQEFGSWEVVKETTFTPKRDNKKLGYVKGVETIRRSVKVVEFNPGSRDHIAHILTTRYGWKPTTFTDNGKPEVDESTLKGLDFPVAAELREYLMIDKRLGQLAEGKQAWLKKAEMHPLTKMYHIHGSVNPNGTITMRASHSYPNLGQVTAVGKPYGAESRALFTVPPGWNQIGADASGLELRCLAHYMAKYDDGEYGRIILDGKQEDGTDIHSRNRDALGLEGKAGRDMAKTFIYAFLYGAGDEKLGSILEPSASSTKQARLGKKLKNDFLRGFPALGYLQAAVGAKAKRDGYLTVLDGRKVFVRHEHAALNTLLQSAGSIICKKWITNFDEDLEWFLGPQGWTGKWAALGWIHDEVQLAVRPDYANIVVQKVVQAIRDVTEQFQFRVMLDGEARVGRNWAETH